MVAAPRMHTDGNMDLRLEESFAQEDARAFRTNGYEVERVVVPPSARRRSIWSQVG